MMNRERLSKRSNSDCTCDGRTDGRTIADARAAGRGTGRAVLVGRVGVKRAMVNGSQSVRRGRTILTDVIVADLLETVISGLRCRSNDLFVLRVFTPAFTSSTTDDGCRNFNRVVGV